MMTASATPRSSPAAPKSVMLSLEEFLTERSLSHRLFAARPATKCNRARSASGVGPSPRLQGHGPTRRSPRGSARGRTRTRPSSSRGAVLARRPDPGTSREPPVCCRSSPLGNRRRYAAADPRLPHPPVPRPEGTSPRADRGLAPPRRMPRAVPARTPARSPIGRTAARPRPRLAAGSGSCPPAMSPVNHRRLRL